MTDGRVSGTRRGFWPSFSDSGASSSGTADGAIAVIGIAGRFPRSSTVEELWDHLRKGEDCVTEVPEDRWERARTFRVASGCRWGGFIADADRFDASFFETDWRAECSDPQERVLLEGVWHLLERSGYTRRRLLETCKSAVGVYIGVMNRDYGNFRAPSSWWLEAVVSNANQGYIANRISHFFDLRGPSTTVDTFCSSSAVALHLACQDLRSGDCKMAIVGGVNLLLNPDRFEFLSLSKQLGTHENSRSFADGDGYIPAEVAGTVLLKPLANAVEDGDNILGVIRATSVNHGGRSAAFGVPDPDAQADVIENCLRKAGLAPSDIGYIEASASGAALGDPLELAALRRVFDQSGTGARRWPIGSVKSNLGHAEAASAIAQLAKVLLQFGHGQMVPSIKADPPNPRLDWKGLPFYLVRDLQEWEPPRAQPGSPGPEGPRRALLNSFGGGGTNASVLLEEYVPARTGGSAQVARPAGRNEEVIVLSARNTVRLRALIERMLTFVSSSAEVPVADLAYTLQFGREPMKSRVAFVARNREDVIAGLTACLRSSLEAVGRIEAEMPVFYGEVAGANLFRRAAADRNESDVDANGQDASRMALEWCQGASISWPSSRPERRRFLVLPTYPFARERCWLAVLTHHHPELHSQTESDALAGAHQQKAGGEQAPATRDLEGNRATYVAPRNALEHSFVQIWQEVTGARQVGVKESFFDIGGDSMLALLVVNRCQEAFGVQTDVSLLLGREGTIERLAVATVAALARAQIEDRTSLEAIMDEVMTETTQ